MTTNEESEASSLPLPDAVRTTRNGAHQSCSTNIPPESISTWWDKWNTVQRRQKAPDQNQKQKHMNLATKVKGDKVESGSKECEVVGPSTLDGAHMCYYDRRHSELRQELSVQPIKLAENMLNLLGVGETCKTEWCKEEVIHFSLKYTLSILHWHSHPKHFHCCYHSHPNKRIKIKAYNSKSGENSEACWRRKEGILVKSLNREINPLIVIAENEIEDSLWA